MKSGKNFLKSNFIFIANGVVFCLTVLLLVFLRLYSIGYSSQVLNALSVVVFAIIIFWKIFLLVIGIVAVLGLIGVFNSNEKAANPLTKVLNEIIFTNLGLTLSIAAGFIFSMAIRTGKPDIDLNLFFSSFNNAFVLYLTIRLGAGLLVYARKANKRSRV